MAECTISFRKNFHTDFKKQLWACVSEETRNGVALWVGGTWDLIHRQQIRRKPPAKTREGYLLAEDRRKMASKEV